MQMVIKQQVKKDVIINEITIMKESHHPNIVNYIDSYILEGTLWVSVCVIKYLLILCVRSCVCACGCACGLCDGASSCKCLCACSHHPQLSQLH